MRRRKQVFGDRSLLAMLVILRDRAAVDDRSGQERLFLEFEAAVSEEEATFRRLLNAVDDSKRMRADAVAKRDRLKKKLAVTVRDFWTVVKLRTNRMEHPKTTPALFFPRGVSTRQPKSADLNYWLGMGRHIVAADAKAQERGLPAMANPAAAEIEALLAAGEDAGLAVHQAQEAYTQSLIPLEAHRKVAHQLIRDVADSMQRKLRDLEPAKRRRIMRSYGFRFERDKTKRQ